MATVANGMSGGNDSRTELIGEKKQQIYRDIDASNVEELETTKIDSLCMECEEEGETRLLLTKIPLFKEVIIASFSCPHCGHSNNEIMDGSTTPDDGVKYTLQVNTLEDLNCMMVKANSCSLTIPELEFEIPPKTQRGSINTLEGFITLSINGLEKEQPTRKALYPEVYEKLEEFIAKLKTLMQVKTPFTVIVDDPTGNSFVENKMAPMPNPNLCIEHYTRTAQQDSELGIVMATQSTGSQEIDKDEILSFQDTCSNCNNPVETRMKTVDIPHFKQVILMACVCDLCGCKSNEVKSGSGISEKGSRITLHLTNQFDLSRDILKAETASLRIPELDLELMSGTLGGRFTTVEGLLVNIKDQLCGLNVFSVGDSATKENKMAGFLEKLQKIIDGKLFGVHLVIDDPAGNSYLQNLYAPEKDPEIEIEEYTRTLEDNEELGIDLMKTEDY